MGSPKALLEYRGETFAGRLARVLSSVCDPVIMVLGHHEDVIRPRLPAGIWIVVNPEPERGQLSSLQTALKSVPTQADGFLFTPVDCPAMEPETVKRLAETLLHRDPATRFVIPRYLGRHGHPVCAARALLSEFLELPITGQASDVVHRHVGQTQYVDVDDAGVLADIDDPEGYQRLAGRLQ